MNKLYALQQMGVDVYLPNKLASNKLVFIKDLSAEIEVYIVKDSLFVTTILSKHATERFFRLTEALGGAKKVQLSALVSNPWDKVVVFTGQQEQYRGICTLFKAKQYLQLKAIQDITELQDKKETWRKLQNFLLF